MTKSARRETTSSTEKNPRGILSSSHSASCDVSDGNSSPQGKERRGGGRRVRKCLTFRSHDALWDRILFGEDERKKKEERSQKKAREKETRNHTPDRRTPTHTEKWSFDQTAEDVRDELKKREGSVTGGSRDLNELHQARPLVDKSKSLDVDTLQRTSVVCTLCGKLSHVQSCRSSLDSHLLHLLKRHSRYTPLWVLLIDIRAVPFSIRPVFVRAVSSRLDKRSFPSPRAPSFRDERAGPVSGATGGSVSSGGRGASGEERGGSSSFVPSFLLERSRGGSSFMPRTLSSSFASFSSAFASHEKALREICFPPSPARISECIRGIQEEIRVQILTSFRVSLLLHLVSELGAACRSVFCSDSIPRALPQVSSLIKELTHAIEENALPGCLVSGHTARLEHELGLPVLPRPLSRLTEEVLSLRGNQLPKQNTQPASSDSSPNASPPSSSSSSPLIPRTVSSEAGGRDRQEIFPFLADSSDALSAQKSNQTADEEMEKDSPRLEKDEKSLAKTTPLSSCSRRSLGNRVEKQSFGEAKKSKDEALASESKKDQRNSRSPRLYLPLASSPSSALKFPSIDTPRRNLSSPFTMRGVSPTTASLLRGFPGGTSSLSSPFLPPGLRRVDRQASQEAALRIALQRGGGGGGRSRGGGGMFLRLNTLCNEEYEVCRGEGEDAGIDDVTGQETAKSRGNSDGLWKPRADYQSVPSPFSPFVSKGETLGGGGGGPWSATSPFVSSLASPYTPHAGLGAGPGGGGGGGWLFSSLSGSRVASSSPDKMPCVSSLASSSSSCLLFPSLNRLTGDGGGLGTVASRLSDEAASTEVSKHFLVHYLPALISSKMLLPSIVESELRKRGCICPPPSRSQHGLGEKLEKGRETVGKKKKAERTLPKQGEDKGGHVEDDRERQSKTSAMHANTKNGRNEEEIDMKKASKRPPGFLDPDFLDSAGSRKTSFALASSSLSSSSCSAPPTPLDLLSCCPTSSSCSSCTSPHHELEEDDADSTLASSFSHASSVCSGTGVSRGSKKKKSSRCGQLRNSLLSEISSHLSKVSGGGLATEPDSSCTPGDPPTSFLSPPLSASREGTATALVSQSSSQQRSSPSLSASTPREEDSHVSAAPSSNGGSSSHCRACEGDEASSSLSRSACPPEGRRRTSIDVFTRPPSGLHSAPEIGQTRASAAASAKKGEADRVLAKMQDEKREERSDPSAQSRQERQHGALEERQVLHSVDFVNDLSPTVRDLCSNTRRKEGQKGGGGRREQDAGQEGPSPSTSDLSLGTDSEDKKRKKKSLADGSRDSRHPTTFATITERGRRLVKAVSLASHEEQQSTPAYGGKAPQLPTSCSSASSLPLIRLHPDSLREDGHHFRTIRKRDKRRGADDSVSSNVDGGIHALYERMGVYNHLTSHSSFFSSATSRQLSPPRRSPSPPPPSSKEITVQCNEVDSLQHHRHQLTKEVPRRSTRNSIKKEDEGSTVSRTSEIVHGWRPNKAAEAQHSLSLASLTENKKEEKRRLQNWRWTRYSWFEVFALTPQFLRPPLCTFPPVLPTWPYPSASSSPSARAATRIQAHHLGKPSTAGLDERGEREPSRDRPISGEAGNQRDVEREKASDENHPSTSKADERMKQSLRLAAPDASSDVLFALRSSATTSGSTVPAFGLAVSSSLALSRRASSAFSSPSLPPAVEGGSFPQLGGNEGTALEESALSPGGAAAGAGAREACPPEDHSPGNASGGRSSGGTSAPVATEEEGKNKKKVCAPLHADGRARCSTADECPAEEIREEKFSTERASCLSSPLSIQRVDRSLGYRRSLLILLQPSPFELINKSKPPPPTSFSFCPSPTWTPGSASTSSSPRGKEEVHEEQEERGRRRSGSPKPTGGGHGCFGRRRPPIHVREVRFASSTSMCSSAFSFLTEDASGYRSDSSDLCMDDTVSRRNPLHSASTDGQKSVLSSTNPPLPFHQSAFDPLRGVAAEHTSPYLFSRVLSPTEGGVSFSPPYGEGEGRLRHRYHSHRSPTAICFVAFAATRLCKDCLYPSRSASSSSAASRSRDHRRSPGTTVLSPASESPDSQSVVSLSSSSDKWSMLEGRRSRYERTGEPFVSRREEEAVEKRRKDDALMSETAPRNYVQQEETRLCISHAQSTHDEGRRARRREKTRRRERSLILKFLTFLSTDSSRFFAVRVSYFASVSPGAGSIGGQQDDHEDDRDPLRVTPARLSTAAALCFQQWLPLFIDLLVLLFVPPRDKEGSGEEDQEQEEARRGRAGAGRDASLVSVSSVHSKSATTSEKKESHVLLHPAERLASLPDYSSGYCVCCKDALSLSPASAAKGCSRVDQQLQKRFSSASLQDSLPTAASLQLSRAGLLKREEEASRQEDDPHGAQYKTKLRRLSRYVLHRVHCPFGDIATETERTRRGGGGGGRGEQEGDAYCGEEGKAGGGEEEERARGESKQGEEGRFVECTYCRQLPVDLPECCRVIGQQYEEEEERSCPRQRSGSSGESPIERTAEMNDDDPGSKKKKSGEAGKKTKSQAAQRGGREVCCRDTHGEGLVFSNHRGGQCGKPLPRVSRPCYLRRVVSRVACKVFDGMMDALLVFLEGEEEHLAEQEKQQEEALRIQEKKMREREQRSLPEDQAAQATARHTLQRSPLPHLDADADIQKTAPSSTSTFTTTEDNSVDLPKPSLLSLTPPKKAELLLSLRQRKRKGPGGESYGAGPSCGKTVFKGTDEAEEEKRRKRMRRCVELLAASRSAEDRPAVDCITEQKIVKNFSSMDGRIETAFRNRQESEGQDIPGPPSQRLADDECSLNLSKASIALRFCRAGQSEEEEDEKRKLPKEEHKPHQEEQKEGGSLESQTESRAWSFRDTSSRSEVCSTSTESTRCPPDPLPLSRGRTSPRSGSSRGAEEEEEKAVNATPQAAPTSRNEDDVGDGAARLCGAFIEREGRGKALIEEEREKVGGRQYEEELSLLTGDGTRQDGEEGGEEAVESRHHTSGRQSAERRSKDGREIAVPEQRTRGAVRERLEKDRNTDHDDTEKHQQKTTGDTSREAEEGTRREDEGRREENLEEMPMLAESEEDASRVHRNATSSASGRSRRTGGSPARDDTEFSGRMHWRGNESLRSRVPSPHSLSPSVDIEAPSCVLSNLVVPCPSVLEECVRFGGFVRLCDDTRTGRPFARRPHRWTEEERRTGESGEGRRTTKEEGRRRWGREGLGPALLPTSFRYIRFFSTCIRNPP